MNQSFPAWAYLTSSLVRLKRYSRIAQTSASWTHSSMRSLRQQHWSPRHSGSPPKQQFGLLSTTLVCYPDNYFSSSYSRPTFMVISASSATICSPPTTASKIFSSTPSVRRLSSPMQSNRRTGLCRSGEERFTFDRSGRRRSRRFMVLA